MDSATVVAALALVGASFSALLSYRTSSRANSVNQQAGQQQWAKDMSEEASEARNEVKELREQVRTLHRQVDTLTRELDHWISIYQLVHRTAWRPGMTLDRVRELLGPETPAGNGRPTP